ncbi:S1C family serine protease [Haloimpatiens lingqiaonensis]|uniref:S1C family serine protease n=1 Tax=Haloimpatiens lingqiaonensis TaxID=1380675 RepID=UPI0010FE57B7|nr:trypsin-like peptidase domain-containing protein [Haloimpatiens lingqiaonensis]
MGEYKENDGGLVTDEYNNYHIKFRKNKKNGIFKKIIYFIIFVLVAMISGAATANYVVENKYSQGADKTKETPAKSINNSNDATTRIINANPINKVAETVGPAVVAISNRAEGFFGDVKQGTGSGIIFNEEGYIVTNNHVIEGATKLTVKLSSGKELEAKVVGKDPKSDLAVIKVNSKNLPVAKFGDSSKMKVGDLAVAIGNPLGEEFAGSVTAGIISALNRKIVSGEAVYKVLQTDAAINPGNSGGALCNENGEVIGINSLKLGAQVNAEGMGFAIAINEAKGIIDQLMKNGKVIRPIMGIYGGTVNPQATGGIEGVYVTKLVPNSGAEKSGIQAGDILTEFDNKKIKSFSDLSAILFEHKVGDVVSCKVWRNGETEKYKIRLSEAE